ncbi:MAG: hypothetical protein K0R17_3074 [Rariglobus sp.]|jgi:hypothetical protein|nr:hypothetical protein [Rariglobus sp.]
MRKRVLAAGRGITRPSGGGRSGLRDVETQEAAGDAVQRGGVDHRDAEQASIVQTRAVLKPQAPGQGSASVDQARVNDGRWQRSLPS